MKQLSQDVLDYIREHGYTPEELSEDELAALPAEVEMVRKGIPFLDGVFASKPQYK